MVLNDCHCLPWIHGLESLGGPFEPDLLAILYLAIGLTNAKHCSVFKNVTLFFLKLPCQLFISHDFSSASPASPPSPSFVEEEVGGASLMSEAADDGLVH